MNETRFAGFHLEKATNAGNLKPRFSLEGLYVSGVKYKIEIDLIFIIWKFEVISEMNEYN